MITRIPPWALALGAVLAVLVILAVATRDDDVTDTAAISETVEPGDAAGVVPAPETGDPGDAGDSAGTPETADLARIAEIAEPGDADRCETQAVLAAHGVAVLSYLAAEQENPVFSPEGLRSVFEVLDWGASEDARRRIAAYYRAVAAFEATDGSAFRLADCAWRHDRGAGEPAIEAHSADHLFLRGGIAPLPAIAARMEARARATELHTVPDADFGAWLDAVNRAIAESTGGLIENALDLRPSTVFAVANVMAFDAPWMVPFDPALTAGAPFTMAGGATVSVAMMRSAPRDVLLAEDDAFLRVLLLYADRDHYMHLVLPKDLPGEGGAALEWPDPGVLGVRTAMSEFQDAPAIDWPGSVERAVLWLPRFDVAGEGDLSEHMKATGHGGLLGDGSAFAGLTGQALLLDQITQKVRVRTDEEGSAAAAVTTAQMSRAMVEPDWRDIRFDRPFLYAIGQASTGAILAMGVVGRPEPMEEATE